MYIHTYILFTCIAIVELWEACQLCRSSIWLLQELLSVPFLNGLFPRDFEGGRNGPLRSENGPLRTRKRSIKAQALHWGTPPWKRSPSKRPTKSSITSSMMGLPEISGRFLTYPLSPRLLPEGGPRDSSLQVTTHMTRLCSQCSGMGRISLRQYCFERGPRWALLSLRQTFGVSRWSCLGSCTATMSPY